MGNLKKKPNVEFSAAPVSVPPVKTAKSGKRGAEEALEKPSSSKKHKIEVEKLFQKENNAKKLKKKLFQKENNANKLKEAPIDAPMEKKDETSSSGSSSDSEEEVSAAPVSVPPVKMAKSGKRGAEEALEKPASSKKHKIEAEKLFQKENNAKKLKKAPIDTPMEKKDETNSSGSSSDSEEERPFSKPMPDGDESSYESSGESDDERQNMKLRAHEYISTNVGKSTAKPSKKDSSSDEDDNDSTDESSDVEASKSQQHRTKRGTDRSTKDVSDKEPNTPAYRDEGSGFKTLFVGNLSLEATRDDVLEFFKRAGEVVDVRLTAKEDGSFWGFGHVEFAAEEDAQKALSMNREMLLGRSVRLDLARERGSSDPHEGKENGSYKKGGEGPGQTVFVAGFGRSLDNYQHRDKFEECFRSCGKIVRVIIPQDNGLSKGFAYVLFANRGAASKALGLNGTAFKGCILTVELAKNDARFCRSRGSKDKSTTGVRSHDGGDRGHGGYTFKAEEPKLDAAYSGGRGRSARGVVGSDDGGVRGRGRGGRGRGLMQSFTTASIGKKITSGDND